MNIDIVNKQISNELNIKEKEVARITEFYWRRVKEHITSYDSTPVNIPNLFVLFPDKYLLKHTIVHYIAKIRKVQRSSKFTENSIKQKRTIDHYKKVLRQFLRIRKENQFTN